MQNNLPLTPIQLDVSTAIKLTKNEGMFKERSLMARNDAWHRIKIIHGAKYDKEFVLQAIITSVEPADLIPVRYQSIGVSDTCFIARNCGPAIEKLCKNNLIIRIPKSDPLILIITLAFASIQDIKVSIQPLILAALTKRFDQNKRSLDLNDFHRDEDIAKHVYCPLSQTRTFNHVLKLTKTALAAFECLNLQNNQLTSLTALENCNLPIRILDLRNNNLIGMEALTPIRTLSIVELWLDGNPLCENYSSAKQYIDSAKKYCPNLVKLDSIALEPENIPLTINNYLPNKKIELCVKQFANHFFVIHDQMDKMMLKGLYHDKAIYSLALIMNSSVSGVKNVAHGMGEHRTLLRQLDSLKNDNLLYRGPDNILGAIKRLPRCLHDRTTFHYDVIYNDNKMLVFNVDGYLKYNQGGSQLFLFNRTFILIALTDNEYKIMNDQYYIDTNITKIMSTNLEKRLGRINYEITSFSNQEKDRLISTIMNVTTMNREWSRKFLEDVNWNIKHAIHNFMDVYNSPHMPADAF